MASFREILSQLFTRNVVVTRLPGNRLKAFDVNKTQMYGPSSPSYAQARWRRNTGNSGYGYGFINADMEAMRKTMYIDYDLMDADGVISSALDLFAEESTTVNDSGELLVIKTDNEEVKKILHNLFYDVMNIEFNLWSWIRTMCKYGDYFLFMEIREKHGVVNVTPVHPSLIVREEGDPDNPDIVRFSYEGDNVTSYHRISKPQTQKLEAFEVAHFRLLTDPNFLPYGRSAIEPARKVFKSLSLMEDAMLIFRIMRSPDRRLIKIDVGNLPEDSIDAYVEKIANTMKRTPYFDETTNQYNLRFNIENHIEDWFMPVRGSDTGTTVETLPGLENQGSIEDIEYLKNKLHAALKIPKSFLQSDDVGETAKSSLSTQDVRFARTIERIQKIFVSELYKIAIVHLFVQGYRGQELLEFELSLSNPSLIYERQRIELLSSKMDLIQAAKENNIFSDKYIYENILQMTEDEWQAERDQLIEDLKHRFRQTQISEEGNDPAVTGKTFGTPHDIATLHMASKAQFEKEDEMKKLYKQDEREFNQGQPEKITDFETRRNQDFGEDPTGKKDMEKKAGLESFIKKLGGMNYQKLLNENRKVKIKMLDESSLLDDEI